MRIISGKYRGQRLVSFDAKNIRPTTDRVKEDMFNMISGRVQDAQVLDLFSGTGSLGLEALSRGAKHTTFVDSHMKSINVLKSNLEKLKVQKQDYQVVKFDAVKYLQKEPLNGFNLILIDPPFTKAMAHEVMEALGRRNQEIQADLIFIESSKHEKIEDTYGDVIRLYKRKSYGDKHLSVFVCEDEIKT